MKFDFDVDIDMANRDDFLKCIPHTPASINNNGYSKHNSGVYFQTPPKFPLEGYSILDYKDAAEEGYLKIDFLNNSVYEGVRDEAHLDQLIATTPNWDMLLYDEIVEKLFHVSKYADLLKRYKPNSVKQLAMFLALLRPGKKYLIGEDWEAIEKEIWGAPDDGYFFKMSHAHSYAMVIVVQMNLMMEGTIENTTS
jgi:hypothetical protein